MVTLQHRRLPNETGDWLTWCKAPPGWLEGTGGLSVSPSISRGTNKQCWYWSFDPVPPHSCFWKQPAYVGVLLFSCYRQIREQSCLEHCLLKGIRTMRLVYNNILSGRICDFKEKRIKTENRRKRGDGGSRTRATWIEHWWGAYEHQQENKSVHIGMKN